MTPPSILIVAGEPSGDQLAAELVRAVRAGAGTVPPRFFGVGGPAMAEAGVRILHDLTSVSAIGPADALRQYARYRRVFDDLLEAAAEQTPEVVVGVDFGAFNLRFAAALRRRTSADGPFRNWRPKIVQFVSPQVWASRPGRAREIARDHDLLLSILPFEQDWYARNAPGVPVRFVGHPIVDRHRATPSPTDTTSAAEGRSLVLLPGSRPGELRRHWSSVAGAADLLARHHGAKPVLVLPTETARDWLPREVAPPQGLRIRVGGLAEELQRATAAIASTGTVTLECAWFGVPTVALYRTSWSTYQIGRRIIQVRFLALPNLLADKAVIPEFIQDAATPDGLAEAAAVWFRDRAARDTTVAELHRIRDSLGPPGACGRAAGEILKQLRPSTRDLSDG